MERCWCLVGGIDEVGRLGGLVRDGGLDEYREGWNRMLLVEGCSVIR